MKRRPRNQQDVRGGMGSRSGQCDLKDWLVAGWIVFLDWLFDLLQWVLSNLVPQFKNGTLRGTLWAGLAFGIVTLLVRLIRDNRRTSPPPVTAGPAPSVWGEKTGIKEAETRRDQRTGDEMKGEVQR